MSTSNTGRTMLLLASIIVIATLATSMWVMDSPTKQRDRRIDQRRSVQLDAITDAVDVWVASHKRLPVSLVELSSQPGLSLDVVDPVDGKPYRYRETSRFGYEICAHFATSTADKNQGATEFGWYNKRWLHPAGAYCFNRIVAASVTESITENASASTKP